MFFDGEKIGVNYLQIVSGYDSRYFVIIALLTVDYIGTVAQLAYLQPLRKEYTNNLALIGKTVTVNNSARDVTPSLNYAGTFNRARSSPMCSKIRIESTRQPFL